MRKLIKKFIKMPLTKKLLIVKIFCLTGFFRFTLLFLPFKRIKFFLGRERMESEALVDRKIIKESIKISKLVYRVSEITPWESKCLVIALTIKKLLINKKINSTIYLGVNKSIEKKLLAHAWLRVGDKIIAGNCEREEFVQISKFS